MKVLITGANGQLGSDLMRVLGNHEVIGTTHSDVDITDLPSLREACVAAHPALIINTAAYVRVDDCETNRELAYRVNALGARNVAVVAESLGVPLVHVSTDYVFGGEGGARTVPYTEFDKPAPLNVYGASKLAGEYSVRHLCRRHFIVRASGLFGVAGSSGKGGNFIETILRLSKERSSLTVVSDQVFSPSYTLDLARKIGELAMTEMYGVYHVTNSGSCSWYDFAVEALRLAGSKTPVLAVRSDQYPQQARRPAYSVLDHFHLRLLGLDNMRSWQEALAEYMREKGHSRQVS